MAKNLARIARVYDPRSVYPRTWKRKVRGYRATPTPSISPGGVSFYPVPSPASPGGVSFLPVTPLNLLAEPVVNPESVQPEPVTITLDPSMTYDQISSSSELMQNYARQLHRYRCSLVTRDMVTKFLRSHGYRFCLYTPEPEYLYEDPDLGVYEIRFFLDNERRTHVVGPNVLVYGRIARKSTWSYEKKVLQVISVPLNDDSFKERVSSIVSRISANYRDSMDSDDYGRQAISPYSIVEEMLGIK